jgi:hypothetical protein
VPYEEKRCKLINCFKKRKEGRRFERGEEGTKGKKKVVEI